MKLFTLLLLFVMPLTAFAGGLPDAPTPQGSFVSEGMHFNQDNQQWERNQTGRVFDKPFIISNSIAAAATVFDIETTMHGRCGEATEFGRRPSRAELYGTDLSIFGVLFGFQALVKATHVPGAKYWSLGIPAAESVVHFKAGAEWYTRGCM
jgi:hypothetical protein